MAASASSNATSARKLQLGAIRGGERVVGREFRLARYEAYLAAEFALDAIDADDRWRAYFDARTHRLGHMDACERRGRGEQHGHRGAGRGLLALVVGQCVDRGIQRRAHFQARRAGLQSGEIGACTVGGLARLRELLGARAFLQFAQVRLGFAQVGFGGLRRARPGGRRRICSPGCASPAPATGRVRAPRRCAVPARRRAWRSMRESWCCVVHWRVPPRGTRLRRVARGPRRARPPRWRDPAPPRSRRP